MITLPNMYWVLKGILEDKTRGKWAYSDLAKCLRFQPYKDATHNFERWLLQGDL